MVGPQQAHEAVNGALEILAHHRRRYALECLREFQTPLPLADLADEVAVREYDEPLPVRSAETVKEVYISLYHTHIPKLADAGLVRYSQERDAVSLREHTDRFDQLRVYLESSRSVPS